MVFIYLRRINIKTKADRLIDSTRITIFLLERVLFIMVTIQETSSPGNKTIKDNVTFSSGMMAIDIILSQAISGA